MSEHPDSPVETELGHERRDVSVGTLTILFFAMEACLIATLVFGYALHKGYLHFNRPSQVGLSPVADYKRQPPEPRLQAIPVEDVLAYRERMDRLSSSYEWIDSAAGIVRLPIERAKQLVAERGLPAREGKTP